MNQRLTIELPDEIVSRLREMAALQGVQVEEMVAEWARTHASSRIRPEVLSAVDEILDEYNDLHRRLA